MKDIRIIFFDIDGTLIDMEKKHMTDTMLHTLRQLKRRGYILCLATGRGPSSLPRFEGVEFDAFLTFNGSYCFTPREDLFSNPLPAEDVDTLLRNAASIGRPVSIATADRYAANGADEDLIQYYAFAGKEVEIPDDFHQLIKSPVYQVMLGCRESDHPALLRGTRNTKAAAWWDRAADFIPADGGKGSGIRKILEHFGLSRENALAFGDGSNDIEMLQAVGTGIAMGNASDKVKAQADAVCPCVGDEGITSYCMEHGLL